MDIFISNVPAQTNHNELRVFLRDTLQRFDIRAYDVVKKPKLKWAIVTLPDENRGNHFLQYYGSKYRGQPVLAKKVFQGNELNFKKSNKIGQPTPLQVEALLEAERKIRSKLTAHVPSSVSASNQQPIFPFLSLSTGIWTYSHLKKLNFHQKFRDARKGTVTLGKHALVIYLRAGIQDEFDWHGRIDIQYANLQ